MATPKIVGSRAELGLHQTEKQVFTHQYSSSYSSIVFALHRQGAGAKGPRDPKSFRRGTRAHKARGLPARWVFLQNILGFCSKDEHFCDLMFVFF